jgi:hypothetical protein
VAEAIRRARAYVGHLVKIEVDTLPELEEALGVGVDAVLLDNMSLDELKRGVNLISVGCLTHSAPILDVGLETARGGPTQPRGTSPQRRPSFLTELANGWATPKYRSVPARGPGPRDQTEPRRRDAQTLIDFGALSLPR